MTIHWLIPLSLLALLSAATFAHAQGAAPQPWFGELKFGMFVHWGLYSAAAGEWNGKPIDGYGEWIMEHGRIPATEYERLASEFHGAHFNADAWVSLAKEAGMTYLVVTSKHHDGFCLWPTKVTPFNVADATPLHRDPLAELSAACKKAGLRFGIYYSIMDWRHPELAGYWKADAGAAVDPADPRVARYIEGQLKPQLRELIGRYDPAILWFDGEWVPWWSHAHGDELHAYCRSLKADVVVNNRIGKRTPQDGDFDTPEQEIPADAQWHRPWETCMTLNDTWGYKRSDEHWKSGDEILAHLRQINERGGNLLLNIGPDADGVIPPASAAVLREVSRHLRDPQLAKGRS